MPGPVERWLETFMCTQYAELFDAYGFKTLQSVCRIQMSHLMSMGIPQAHCEIIHQNVEVLRQSIQGQTPYRSEESYYRNRMSHGMQNSSFDRQHMNSRNMNYNQQMAIHGGYEQQQRAMMQQMQGSRFPTNQQNHQQSYPTSGLKPDYPNMQGHMRPGPDGDYPGSFHRQPNPFPHGAGGTGMNQASMNHPHLHRNSNQNPQEVANNILQMASSTYPPNNTVQVPLSKGRSAPYHVPQRSGHYPSMSPGDPQLQHQQQIQQMQFTYPSSSTCHMSPRSTMSPVSPASASVMSSPHSIHSGHVPSPASMHSPRMGHVRSPGSDMGNPMMRTPDGSVQNYQQMNSPGRNQYHVASPGGAPHSHMVSPVTVNQQLHVSSPSPGQYHQNYRDMTNMASPTKYSSCSNIQPSPGSQSVHHSNMSSPYTPSSHPSPHSPHGQQQQQQHTNNTPYISSANIQTDSNQQTSGRASQVNPLQSLQKLCMLPETRVVDPKSVVNDTCAPSPQSTECSRNSYSYQDDNQQNNYQQQPYGSVHSDKGHISDYNSDNVNQHEYNTNMGQPTHTFNLPLDSASNSLSSDNAFAEKSDFSGAPPQNVEGSNEQRTDTTSNTSLPFSSNRDNLSEKDTSNEFEKSHTKTQLHNSNECHGNSESKQFNHQANTEEIKCQPKKIKLLRATGQWSRSDQQIEGMGATQHNDDFETGQQSNIAAPRIVSGAVIDKSQEMKSLNPVNDSKISDLDIVPLEKGSNQTDKNIDLIDKTNISATEKGKHVEPVQVKESEIAKDDNVMDIVKVSDKDAADSGLSDSEEDSHLSVKKELHLKTYSKADRFKDVIHQSEGSVSGEVSESDLEFEDHIGCDDIDTNFSDMDEKENFELIEDLAESVDNVADEECDTITVNKSADKHILHSPHWKKSRLNNLNSADSQDVCKESNTKNGKRNGLRRVSGRVNDVIDVDSDVDIETVPSPNGGIDTMAIDNNDGTMYLTQSHRIVQRQRKTPLKYRDTSFFKGEFMFEDEEIEYKPEPKLVKKSNGVDFNHNNRKERLIAKRNKSFRGCDKSKPLTNGLHDDNTNGKAVKGKATSNNMNRPSQTNGDADIDSDQVDSDNESPADGNKTRSQRGSRRRSRVHQTTNNIGHQSNASRQVNKKTKPINGLSKDNHSTTSDVSSKLKASDKPKVKPLNGLKSAKETRKRTRNCSFENEKKKENVHDKKNEKAESTSVVCDSDSDRSIHAQVICIDDDNDDNHAAVVDEKVFEAKVSCVKLENDTSVVKAKSKGSCDSNGDSYQTEHSSLANEKIKSEPDTNQTESSSNVQKIIKSESDTKNVVKQKRDRNKQVKRGAKSQKKTNTSSKAMKKFQFESDEEFDPTNSSLKGLNLKRTQHLLKKKKKVKAPDGADDFKGPLVRLEGKKDAPDKCVVINERLDPTSTNKTKTVPQAVATRIQISHLPSDKSVLIPQSSAEEGNQWLCALCGKHSSYRFLGDLFGPYTVDNSDDTEHGSFSVKPVKKRKSEENSSGAIKPSRTSRRMESITKESDSLKEVWVHESCSVWSDGVFLIGPRIYGLQEAIAVANKTPCTHCLEMGAMIGCLNKGCKEKYHFSCAVEKDCYLDEENFSLLCPKHKNDELVIIGYRERMNFDSGPSNQKIMIKKLKPPEPSTSTSIT